MPDIIEWQGRKIDVDAQLLALDRVECEDSLTEFLMRAWRFIDPAPFKPGWVIDALADHLEAVCDGDIRRLVINVPPRCSKSSIISIAFPAWVWAQEVEGPISGPRVPFLHASYSFELSIRDSVKCRRLIKSTWYRKLWGDRFEIISEQDQKKRFRNSKDGERLITSIGAAVTGEGGNCFVAGTVVGTPTGPRAIETLLSGDAVLAFDHSRGKVVSSKITATAVRTSDDLWQLCTFSGRTFVCTSDHSIYSPGRGYIEACRLGPGDWLLAQDGTSDRVESSLRYVRGTSGQAVVRGAQGAEAGQPRRLLFEGLQPAAPQYETQASLRSVRQACARSTYSLLLAAVRLRREISTPPQAAMSVLRSTVHRLQRLLLRNLRRSCTLEAYAGREKQSIRGAWSLLEFIPRDGRSCAHKRWSPLRGLHSTGQYDQALSRAEAFDPAGSPYRREYATQQAGESDNALHVVSLEMSSGYVEVVGDTSVSGAQSIAVYDIQVEGFSNFFAGGILAHNCIIIDDPNAANEMLSEAVIKTTNEDWWDGTMSTRLNDASTGAFIVVQQRLGEQDLTGHILEKDSEKEWTHLFLPMEYEPSRSCVTSVGWEDPRTVEGELLWPERFPKIEVDRLKRNLLSWRSAGQLQQRPEPVEGGVIKRAWWMTWPPEGEKKDAAGNPVGRLLYPPCDFILAYVDTAYTVKQMNDMCAMTVWGVFSGDTVARDIKINEAGESQRVYSESAARVILLTAWSERLEFNALVQKVQVTAGHPSKGGFDVDMLVIENKAAGITLGQEMLRLFGNENYTVILDDPKGIDKLARLYSIQHIFSGGMVYAPDRVWADQVIAQCATFPNARHDDLVDTTSGGLRKLRALGLLARGEEVTQDLDLRLRSPTKAPGKLYPG